MKNKDIIGEKFVTTKGIPQGDSMSLLLFTLYLAKTLDTIDNNNDLEIQETEHNYSKSRNLEPKTPAHLIDHNYHRI